MTPHKINPRTVLITGAYRGLGLETGRQLAKRGFDVTLTARSEDKAKAAAKALQEDGLTVRVLKLDVTDPDSARKAALQFAKTADQLDVLINNAAVIPPGDEETTIAQTDFDAFEKALRTNAIGPAIVIQAFLPLLRESSAPRIVNVSSGAGMLSEMGTWAPAYSVSKTALNAVTVQFANALGGIAVNSVCPGWVRTEMGGKDAPRSVEEGASGIVWLAADAPPNLTGKALRDRKVIAW